MRPPVVLLLAALLLVVPAAAAVSYTQPGNGPGRTGVISFHGPATNDTAFEQQLPGVPMGQPALIDGQAFLVTIGNEWVGYDGDTTDLTETALWRIDLSSGTYEQVLEVPEGMLPYPMHLDPDHLILLDPREETLSSVEVPSGEERWTIDPLAEGPRHHWFPRGAAEVDGTFYLAYQAWGADAPETPLGSTTVPTDAAVGLASIDLETGQVHWTRIIQDLDTNRAGGVGLSADEHRLYLYSRQTAPDPAEPVADASQSVYTEVYESQYMLQAFSANDGDLLWSHNDTPQREVDLETPVTNMEPISALGYGCCGYAAVTDAAIHIRLDAFEAFNPATGERVWPTPSEAGRSDHVRSQGSSGMGVGGDTLIATSTQTVYRLDAFTGDMVWQHTEPDQWFSNTPVTLTDDTAHVPIGHVGDDCFLDIGMEARDLKTGELLWRWWHEPTVGRDTCGWNQRSGMPAFGPGVMLWGSKDGTVTVLGGTGASLGAPQVDETLYPAPDEPVLVDLSDTAPGAFGEATRYMVDWGDGTVSGWQADPVFEHTYPEERAYRARVIAGNDANQTSSAFVTMAVGAEQPNWVSERFAPENQEMTFGVLGIAMALGGGIVGVTRRYRKRSRLERELEVLETGFAETRDRPGKCEALLETRQARARSLVLDGDLDEQQAAMVEARAEELKRQLRTHSLQHEFGFLPYSLVHKAQEMLEDGRVTALEREAFLHAVEEDNVLSDEQRARVRERIEDWFGRDAGGGGGT